MSEREVKVPKKESNSSLKRTKSYFIYLLIILILVDLVDQYSTNYINTFPSLIVQEFLSGYPSKTASSIFAICVGIASVGMYFVFFNQYFADKVGRKNMLAITTFGMGVASLLLSLSTNIVMYTIFLFMVYMFFSSDMWLIYINEEAPAERRATWTDIVLATGVVGPILIPIFRSMFISETSSNWRAMTLFPILISIPLGIIILLTVKETSTYEEMKEKASKEELTVYLKENVRLLFASPRRKELSILFLMSFFAGLNYAFISLGENFIATNSTNIGQNEINLIIYSIAFSVITGYLITGVLADKIGRVPLLYVYSVLLPLSVILTVFGTTFQGGILLLATLGFSLTYVSYWGLVLVLRIITVEITPTNKRGTGSGMRAFINAIGTTVGLFLSGLIVIFFGQGLSFIFISLPMFIHLPLVYLFIKETKGTDLSFVEYSQETK